jgi:hypothetical protein
MFIFVVERRQERAGWGWERKEELVKEGKWEKGEG